MKTLLFNVEESKLVCSDNTSKTFDDSTQIRLVFDGSFWSRCRAVVVFVVNGKENAIPIHSERIISIPTDLPKASFIRVKIVGEHGSKRVTTNTVILSREV